MFVAWDTGDGDAISDYYTNNECLWVQWYEHFHEVKDEMFHSPNENICSIARMRNIHYLFYITCTKIQILKQI